MGKWSTPVPTRLGRYTLLGKLARGGMAELFLAKSEGIEGFEKIVVLKRILPSFAEDEEFIELFISEARLAAQLDHANIVHVHDIGRDGKDFFFTMEYLHGHDVRHLLNEARRRDHRLPLKFVLAIVAGAAAGLHHAHKQVDFSGQPLGIVHRDISPSNIIITYSGHVKMVDFGIAKAAALSRASRASSLKGKVAYMSPEQCKGEPVDCRSDVFALGLVMQELLTNQPVFGGLDHIQAIHAVAAGEVQPVEELWPECPPGLAMILGRALKPDPEQRYRSAIDLQRDLERFAHEHRLMLSSAELGEFLEAVFGTKRFPWLDDGGEFTEPEPASVASATVDKRQEAGAAGGTRVATMLAPSSMLALLESSEAPESSEPAAAVASETIVHRGSETSIHLDSVVDAAPRRLGPWGIGAVGALAVVGGLWWGGSLAQTEVEASAAVPSSVSAAEPTPQASEVSSAVKPAPVEPAIVSEARSETKAADTALESVVAPTPEPAAPNPPEPEPTKPKAPKKKPEKKSKPTKPKPKPKPKTQPTKPGDPDALFPC